MKETERSKPEERIEAGEVGSRNLQRDTPFLDRLGFGGGTGRRGSCACVRVPLWSFRRENQKEKKKKKKMKSKRNRGAFFERSRPDKADNEEPAKSNLKKDNR